MSNRSDIRDIERVEPPDLWTEILAREPASFRPAPRFPRRARLATALAILVAVAGVVVPLRFFAFPRGGRPVGAPPGHHTITITEPSGSMEPTIRTGETVVVDLDAYGSNLPERGDVVVFQTEQHPGFTFIKRVIGLPGDMVEQEAGGAVSVNGHTLDEPYVGAVDPKPLGPWTVEPRHVFVMGDNRANSNDSRYALGQIPIRDIEGKVLLAVHPTESPSPPGPAAATGGGTFLRVTYLPPGFELRLSSEGSVSTVPPEQAYARSFGTSTSDQPAALTVAMMPWAPPLDVAREVVRYAGASKLTVRGHAALFLAEGEGRAASTLAWMERDGLLVQIVASRVSEKDLTAVAEGLKVGDRDPQSGGTFDVTYLPLGFAALQGEARPEVPGGPVPRVSLQLFAPVVQGAPVVSVSQGYAPLTPARSALRRLGALMIRGRPAVLFELSKSPGDLAIFWTEEDGLNVGVSGQGVTREELIAVANGLVSG